jgi:hypothetical protein
MSRTIEEFKKELKKRPRIRGVIEDNPEYRHPTEMNGAAGNPLIEALPAPWDWSAKDSPILDKLTTYSQIDRKKLKESASLDRLFQLVDFKTQYFQVLNRHRDLEQSLSFAIRFGYLDRNPVEPRHRRKLHDRLEQFDPATPKPVAAPAPRFVAASNLGFALLGSPGLGKTTSIGRILRLYPQVIQHRKDGPIDTQVVWLFLTCPHDRSTRALCLSFFLELDEILGTPYLEEHFNDTEGELIAAMASVAATLSLGVLVIDEIQFLSGGKEDVLRFLVQLENSLGIPIVRVGTHRATTLLAGNPHQARRSVGIGGKVWKPLAEDDPEWTLFLETLWDHQFTTSFVELDADLARTMHEETQGILTYTVDLFFFAQKNAINTGTEIITVDSLKQAAEEDMVFNRPYIHALRNPNPELVAALEDILAKDFEKSREFFEGQLLLPRKPKAARSSPSQANHASTASCETSSGGAVIPSLQPAPPSTPVAGEPVTPRKKRNREKKVFPAGTIMAICEEAAREHNIAPYEALKNVGLIWNACEFLAA